MDTVTIPNVELLSLGTHFAATGPTPITEQDFASMLAAAADDQVDHAGIRIGHFDPRFDGEPALGWLANLRRVGDKIVGDLTHVPAKLAEVMKSAYRRRSVEIDWNVRTPGGKTYKAVISGLALLGVQKPAVKGLADVSSMYSQGGAVAESTSSLLIVDGTDVNAMFSEGGAPRRADPENGPDTGNRDQGGDAMTDAQIREMFGLAADAPVTDKMRAAAVLQGAITADPVLGELAKLSDDDRKKVSEYAAAVKTAEDAVAKESADAKAKADADAAAAAAGNANGGDPKLVTIDAGALAELQAQGAAGVGAMKILDEQTRDNELVAALSAGKIAPASMAQWKASWDSDRDKTRALLASLPQVFTTVTTGEIGSSSQLSGGAPQAEEAAVDKLLTDIFGVDLKES
jgi:hypothetical protein